jgi:hypothetical protein
MPLPPALRLALAACLAASLAVPGPGAVASHPGTAPRVVQLVVPERAFAAAPPPTELRRRFPWKLPRATRDRPDRLGKAVHVVYVTTTDQPSPALDRLGILEVSLRSQNRWLREQAGIAWRFDTFRFRPPGERRTVRLVDVTFVASGLPSRRLDSLEEVRRLLEARGFDRPARRYLAYVASDAGSVCGEAEYPLSNDPQDAERYGALYLYSDPGCGSRVFAERVARPSWSEAIAMQEFVHNDGIVPLTAPHNCPSAPAHVCTPGLELTPLDPERADVMFPFVSGPLSEKVLDRDRDDYLDHDWPHRDFRQSPYLRRA